MGTASEDVFERALEATEKHLSNRTRVANLPQTKLYQGPQCFSHQRDVSRLTDPHCRQRREIHFTLDFKI